MLRSPRSLREVEAESVALLCCESLALEGADYARGYIQHWLSRGSGFNADAIPEMSAPKTSAPPIKSFESDGHKPLRISV